MIDCYQLRDYVIKPALKSIDLYSSVFEEILVATCARESKGGRNIRQINGPGLGIYNMLPETHDMLWEEVLVDYDKNSDKNINSLGYSILKTCKYVINPSSETMVHNLCYASIMARVYWLTVDEKLPHSDDISGIYEVYKKYWNPEDNNKKADDFIGWYNSFTGKNMTLDVFCYS